MGKTTMVAPPAGGERFGAASCASPTGHCGGPTGHGRHDRPPESGGRSPRFRDLVVDDVAEGGNGRNGSGSCP